MKASLGAASPATIALSEYESIEIALPREVYAAIRARFSGQLDTAPTERRGVYRLTARDSVGRVSLPGGYLLAIRPKISVGNLFYMLSAASGLARFFPPPAGLTPNPEIFSFILAMLVDRAEDLVRKGLYTEHLPVVADHAMVRGRILLSRQVALHAGLQHRHVCA